MNGRILTIVGAIGAFVLAPCALAGNGEKEHSVARLWSEQLLNAIRKDKARPTVHARNLYHTSAAMWDAWAAYGENVDQVISFQQGAAPTKSRDGVPTAEEIKTAREETISYAMYSVLKARFGKSPGAAITIPAIEQQMIDLGYDPNFTGLVGGSPRAVGNRIAVDILYFGLHDNSNEQGEYANLYYEPVNEPLIVTLPGNPDIKDPNRWQPLALDFFIDQGGIVLGPYPPNLSPEWGYVTDFGLSDDDLTIYPHPAEDFDWWVYHDLGDPPYIGGEGDELYRLGFSMVSIWQGMHDPTDGVMVDISPASIGNLPVPAEGEEYLEAVYDYFGGGDTSEGYEVNPVTGLPYEPQIVPRGDYGRVLAEFWADGPNSETPPGHWFTILNYVNDHPLFEQSLFGEIPIEDDLEWDVKAYLALGGTMHDVAVCVWGQKGYYDYIRPVSSIRYMGGQGQSSDADGPSFSEDGIPLVEDWIEVVTDETTKPGGKHEHLAGAEGKIALYSWRGPDYIEDPLVDTAGVGWILADNWWPYQRPTFVSPPFAGYPSGHSCYSRSAAEMMALLTGDEYFPGGMGEFVCPQNEFLVFEEGPSVDLTLQWAKYGDASDQCSLSRIFGGIHPPQDDIPSRWLGFRIGPDSFRHAVKHFYGQISCPSDATGDGSTDFTDLLAVLDKWGPCKGCPEDLNADHVVDFADLLLLLDGWGECD